MNHTAIFICAAILVLLGIRLGWGARIMPLILVTTAAIAGASVFAPVDQNLLKFAILAAFFDLALQSGFTIGLLTDHRRAEF